MAIKLETPPNPTINASSYSIQLRNMAAIGTVTLFATMLLVTFLAPFAYGFITAFKDREQIVRSADGPILPMDPEKFTYEGRELDVFQVPVGDETLSLALLQPGRQESVFVNPDNPDELITWEGSWRTLNPSWVLAPRWGNFERAWNGINFPLLLRNTLVIAVLGMIGTLVSSVLVAYAFARFPIPWKNFLFLVLIGTIILPRQVTLVPTYAFFAAIGWTGTWLPLIVPHFFANAYNVFLFRQYFLSLPKDLDEAAMIDGANPFQILIYVIVPQSWPVIVAVGLFHFVFAWNDYFEPLIYLLGRPNLQPISVGIQQFNFIYDQQPHLIQATALLGLILPVFVFFLAQRFFMRGVVITGVEK